MHTVTISNSQMKQDSSILPNKLTDESHLYQFKFKSKQFFSLFILFTSNYMKKKLFSSHSKPSVSRIKVIISLYFSASEGKNKVVCTGKIRGRVKGWGGKRDECMRVVHLN